jgi:predicted flap endonuclease-1-like 5' DNA nuclease
MMAEPSGNLRCTITCWLIGLLAGILAIVLLRLIGDLSWPGAIFTGGVLFVVLGFLLSLILCKPLPTLEEVQARHANRAGTSGTTAKSAPSGAATPTAAAAPAATASAPASPAASPDPEPVPAPEPEVAPSVAHGDEDKPEMLSAAREGGPDNLKEIKGVGPKLEALLNRLGVFHFDQIASWTDKEVAWVDANLEGFKGRVSRDNWVDQARILAAGGDTEFSKRVGDGDVY